MRATALIHSSLFTLSVLGLGALAVQRALPFDLPENVDVRIGEATRTFETHYDAVFPVKTLGTNLWAAIQYSVFGEGRPGVIIGESDWLYTLEEFRAWPDADARIEAHLQAIADIDRALAQRGSSLVVALVPAKARIYPEFRGEHQPAPLHQDLYARIRRGLLGHGVIAPDLFTALARCKPQAPVFLRTDTHWTPAGARCAAAEVAAAAKRSGRATDMPQRWLPTWGEPQPHAGDLMNFLPLDPYFASLLPPPDTLVPVRTEPAQDVGLLGDTPAPEVALIGTSYSADARWDFTGALQQHLGEDVINLADPGQGPFVPMLAWLRQLGSAPPPRLVIWEIPERYLPAEAPHDLTGLPGLRPGMPQPPPPPARGTAATVAATASPVPTSGDPAS